MLLLAFEAIIKAHQNQFYAPLMRTRPPHGIIFPDITRKLADQSLMNCVKYFANYLFYKFGLEVSALISMCFKYCVVLLL